MALLFGEDGGGGWAGPSLSTTRHPRTTVDFLLILNIPRIRQFIIIDKFHTTGCAHGEKLALFFDGYIAVINWCLFAHSR